MAKRELHEKAIRLRLSGMSYSQIKIETGISKSTLSRWLKDYPLTNERIRELRGNSSIRIEKYRNTRARQRQEKLHITYKELQETIGTLTQREMFLCGLFLYWGEGGKTKPHSVTVSNTDPSIIIFFMKWLLSMGVPIEKMKVHLHLYSDMDFGKEIQYWSEVLSIPMSSFRKPYIKASKRSDITYVQKFTHGTCNLTYDGINVSQRVHAAMQVLQDTFAGGK